MMYDPACIPMPRIRITALVAGSTHSRNAGRAADLLIIPLLEQTWKVIFLNVRAKGLVYPSALFDIFALIIQ